MEPFENTFLNKEKAATTLLEDEPKKDVFENLNLISYPELIGKIEEEIISLRNGAENNDENYRAEILSRKKEFQNNLIDENKINLTDILFGIEELILRDEMAEKKEERTKSMKIEDVKLQQKIAYFIDDNKKDLKLLKDFWDGYDRIFKNDGDETIVNGEMLKHGILAPIALKNILDNKYNKGKEKKMEFIYSTPKDDVNRSIDMMAINEKDKIITLIQVKGDVMNIGELKERIRPKMKSEDKEGKNLIYMIKEEDFSSRDTSMGNKLNEFNSGCAGYMSEHGETLKGFTALGIYIHVPFMIDGQSLIDINGQPHESLEKFISGLLDLSLSNNHANIAKN